MRAHKLLLSILLLVPALTARASNQNLLIEFQLRSEAYPAAVSASGAVVVGTLGGGGGFHWMPTSGPVFVGGAGATNVSRDGRTIVGQAVGSRVLQAAIWVRAAEWKLLGSFPNAVPCDLSLSVATDTSADGRVVVGNAQNGCSLSHAFRWEESTGMVDLGSSVAGQVTLARGVSADGRVIVGYQEDATGFSQGARWVDGRQDLFTGPNGPVGSATATNHDGTIIVGRVCNGAARPTDPGYQSAWIWTARDGVQCLPAPAPRLSPGPPINVEASATSDDGQVIVGGQGIGADDVDAVIWIDRVPHYLKDYLQANGVPNAFATYIRTGLIADVSPDGRVLVAKGAPLAGFRGYMVILGDKP